MPDMLVANSEVKILERQSHDIHFGDHVCNHIYRQLLELSNKNGTTEIGQKVYILFGKVLVCSVSNHINFLYSDPHYVAHMTRRKRRPSRPLEKPCCHGKLSIMLF